MSWTLAGLLEELGQLPHETEWVEFKRNKSDPEEIGEYISALANSAALKGKTNAYMVRGVTDALHQVVGATFRPAGAKKDNEELENWIVRLLNPEFTSNLSSSTRMTVPSWDRAH